MRHWYSPTLALLILLASPALASWPVTGIVVGETLYSRTPGFLYVVPDGGHGVLVHAHLWHMTSRVDPEGEVLWSVNPFMAANLPEPTLYTLIRYESAGDGSGGAWFATLDASRNLVAAHIDETGALTGGITLLSENTAGEPYADAAVPDGAGGMFVVWSEPAAPGDVELRATHVDVDGNVTGPMGGVVVVGGPGVRVFGGAAPDGAGGLLVMTPEAGTTVQRLDAALAPRWGAGAIVTAPAVTGAFALAATGDGGAFVAWPEGRGTADQVRVQRLDANGRVTRGWPAEGAIAASLPRDPTQVHVVADATGGACVAWLDRREEQGLPVKEVRVSRVLANGQIARGWQPAGVLAGGGQEPSLASRSVLVADGTGGCYIAWPDVAFESGQVYAQHVAADGRIFAGWPARGDRLGSDSRNFESTLVLSDGAGGAYVAWDQYDYPMRYRKARLTRLSPGGAGGEPPPAPSLSLARVAPNPASGLFTVSTTMPDDRPAKLEVFDLAGRVSHAREVRGAGERGLTLDGSTLAPGVHWMRLTHPTGVRMARIVVVR